MNVTQPVTVEPWKIAAAVLAAFVLGIALWMEFGWYITCTVDPTQWRCWFPG